MKKFIKLLSYSSAILLLVACGNTEDETTPEEETEEIDEEETSEVEPTEESDDELEQAVEEEETENDPLAEYSEEEIEYARVWFQLGSTDEPGTLNVQRVPAGEPITVVIDDAPTYPEEIIHLTGEAGVMGLVAYSGNGDGTVNYYSQISYRWPTPPSDMPEEEIRAEYESILEHTELVEIDTHDDEDVIRLIEQIEHSE